MLTTSVRLCKPFSGFFYSLVLHWFNKLKIYGKNRARPKPVYLWSVVEVQKWLRRHCSDYYPLYGEKFLQHEITGRVLVRINETSLLRLGIENSLHRQELWREIMKLRLKTDILEIRDLERKDSPII